MKRRNFFKSFAAVVAIAFAEPIALLKTREWVIESPTYVAAVDFAYGDSKTVISRWFFKDGVWERCDSWPQ